MTTRKPLIYVSGPMAGAPGSSYTGNIRLGIDVANDLERHGAHPYVPHTNALWGIVYPGKDYKTIIERDLAFVEACDALVRIPGESKGADEEVAHARKLGIPVFDLKLTSHAVQNPYTTIMRDEQFESPIVRDNDALWTFIETFKPRSTWRQEHVEEIEALKGKVKRLDGIIVEWQTIAERRMKRIRELEDAIESLESEHAETLEWQRLRERERVVKQMKETGVGTFATFGRLAAKILGVPEAPVEIDVEKWAPRHAPTPAVTHFDFVMPVKK